MAKDHIEKTLIVMNEDELQQLLQVARRNETEEIKRYMKEVFIKKVEATLRRRCG